MRLLGTLLATIVIVLIMITVVAFLAWLIKSIWILLFVDLLLM